MLPWTQTQSASSCLTLPGDPAAQLPSSLSAEPLLGSAETGKGEERLHATWTPGELQGKQQEVRSPLASL